MTELKDYDCDSCSVSRQIRFGCESKGEAIEAHFVLGKKQFWRCPKALLKEMPIEDRQFINKLFYYYTHWEKGLLPKPGGIDDQDEFIIMQLPIISSLVKQLSRGIQK